MATELRKTGISLVGDLPWGAHFCYFYETKQDLLDILIPYFKTGLENNEFCLWVISNSELLTVEEATSALRNALPDLHRYLADRSIEIVGHDEWFLSGKTFDPHKVADRFRKKLSEALARGYAGMRVNGSPAWLQDARPKELRKFEAELDKLFPNERTIASCTYPLSMIGPDEIFDVVRTHQFAMARRQGEWEIIETQELIQAKAEITTLNEELEQRVAERTRELAKTNEELNREVSERKQAENALRRSEDRIRLIIDTIPTMAWSLQPDGAIDFVNQRWMDYTGLSLEEAIADQTGTMHPEDLSAAMAEWGASMAAEEPFEGELRLRRADGEYRWFLVRTDPLRDEQGNLVKWYGVSIDIEDRKRAKDRLRSTTEQLRALSASVQSAREEEGTRIARELHDELGSALTSLRWSLDEINNLISTTVAKDDADTLQTKTAPMIRQVETILNTVRRISSELRPGILDEVGLIAAIEWEAQQFEARTGIVSHFDSLVESVRLTPEQSTALFRIFQETLTNILRHAKATRVDITAAAEQGEFVLTIRDNGRGITDEEQSGAKSLGLLGMRERAHLMGGDVNITGIKGQGTVVTVRVRPFPTFEE